MKFSLSTGTLYAYPLTWVFRWARQAGFDGVELVVNPEAILRGGREIQHLAEAEGIEIVSLHPTVVPLRGWRERRNGIGPTIRLAQEIGADLVVMHTPRSESLDEGEGLAFRQRVETWQSRLAGSSLRLAVENKAVRADHEWDYALTPLDRLRTFAERSDLGLVLDTAHAGTAGEDILEARRVFDRWLCNVHLSDLGGKLPLSGLSVVRRFLGEHRFPGDGDLPLAALLADLTRNAYTGPVTLEISPWAAHSWWPPALQRRLAQAMAWLKQASGDGVQGYEPRGTEET